jgi:hypothetical protein
VSVAALEAKPLRHWKKWLLKKVAVLRAEGILEEAVRGAALLAQNQIEHLMTRGYQEHARPRKSLSRSSFCFRRRATDGREFPSLAPRPLLVLHDHSF